MSVIVFKPLLIGVFLFFLSSMAFGSRLPLQIGKSLGSVFGDLKVNTKEISPDEVKFLEDALDKDPVQMLEDPKAGHAIFGTSSSYLDQVYQRLFFPVLTPTPGIRCQLFLRHWKIIRKSIFLNRIPSMPGKSDKGECGGYTKR